MSLGPYRTGRGRTLSYVGNRLHPSGSPLAAITMPQLRSRPLEIATDPRWAALARINGALFSASVRYFEALNATFVPLPLTTRMISSPGAAFGPGCVDYTTDTAPVRLDWFGHDCFLSESSQIYLELALTQPGVDAVYSIYNSFRQEEADSTHLSEFHHLEYEGRGSLAQTEAISEGLVRAIVRTLVSECAAELQVFLSDSQLQALETVLGREALFTRISLRRAYEMLFEDTRDERYLRFTLEDRFGRWEEVRLTELVDGPVAVTGYPLLEVPFYHARDPLDGACALNTDLLWGGYVEVAGIGQRIASTDDLHEKATTFNLPEEDYAPYIAARTRPGFTVTSGFGLGWQRLVQGILCLPSIDLSCPFPRTHLGPMP